MTVDRVLTFGDFRLDPASGHLYRGEAAVPLTPKAFSLLHHLALNAGRLVSKAELMAAIWPDVFVGDAVLKSSIRELRRALGDDSHQPRYIETAHRRGYRFIAPIIISEAPRPPVTHSRVSYAHSGNVNIAYEVIGDGPVDLVFVMGWVSHLEYFWNEPSFARFLRRLSGMARLILFDKRGTGLSDRVSVTELPTLEQRMDDVRAVMEAAGSDRAVLLGVSEGGPLCSLFAATHPARTEALDHDWQLRPPHEGARLSLGRDPGGARRLLPDDPRRMGRAGRHRGACAVARRPTRRFASGGRRTSGWAPARAPRSRSRA